MFQRRKPLAAILACVILFAVTGAQAQRRLSKRLARIPDSALLEAADEDYEALFEVLDDDLISKDVRIEKAGHSGLVCWDRIMSLFPLSYRKLIVEFNVIGGRRWAGRFSGDGSNDVGRKGYRLAVASYLLDETKDLADANRKPTARRGTLDWTLVHEMGHYICLRTNAIELFSQQFDSNDIEQPTRRERPDDYPDDGSPRLDGNFVTSYAERTPGDEEVVETFTTFLLVTELPAGDSLVADKLRFFETMPGFPELRRHVQFVGAKRRQR